MVTVATNSSSSLPNENIQTEYELLLHNDPPKQSDKLDKSTSLCTKAQVDMYDPPNPSQHDQEQQSIPQDVDGQKENKREVARLIGGIDFAIPIQSSNVPAQHNQDNIPSQDNCKYALIPGVEFTDEIDLPATKPTLTPTSTHIIQSHYSYDDDSIEITEKYLDYYIFYYLKCFDINYICMDV